MTDAVASRPLVVHVVARTRSGERRSLDGFELRTVGLGVAAALADIERCPVCRPRPRRAA